MSLNSGINIFEICTSSTKDTVGRGKAKYHANGAINRFNLVLAFTLNSQPFPRY
jgi:hypothetical protein